MYAALDQHLDADIVVLNGDILDGYIFSTFSKAKRIAAIKEYQAAYDLVHWLSDNFENIIIVSGGNHDSHRVKFLLDLVLKKKQHKFLDLICFQELQMEKN